MRFIGAKGLLLEDIFSVITSNINEPIDVVGDLFAGSAIVSQFLKEKGYRVISNDIMYMSYVLARGSLALNGYPMFVKLDMGNPFDILNSITEPLDDKNAFITLNYSPHEHCERMYFQEKNAKKIDGIRQQIEHWRNEGKLYEDEYFYLLAALISAVPYVANITGVYAAYLKHWDKRTYNDLSLKPLPVISSDKYCESFNMDAIELCMEKEFDLVYIDTPYNQRQYIPNYHILETVAKYDNPVIHGVTGMREYVRSDFCNKASAERAFFDLFAALKSKYAVVSYNNEGLLSTDTLLSIFEKFGRVKLHEYEYRRYKSKIPNNDEGLLEQIYFIDLR